jgi:hypothetical protein
MVFVIVGVSPSFVARTKYPLSAPVLKKKGFHLKPVQVFECTWDHIVEKYKPLDGVIDLAVSGPNRCDRGLNDEVAPELVMKSLPRGCVRVNRRVLNPVDDWFTDTAREHLIRMLHYE